MPRRVFGRVLILLALGAIAVLPGYHVGAAPKPAVSTIARPDDPVVLNGLALPNLQGTPVGQLFVYVYQAAGETWTQIPYQIDEVRDNDGSYVAMEDGIFDANDEVTFMAKDLGDDAGIDPSTLDGQPLSGAYKIAVADPLNPGAQGFAYVVRSSFLTQTFTTQYVSFDAANNRIIGATYAIGYTGNIFDYLTLGDSTTDILDRTPKIYGCASTQGGGQFCLTEDNFNLPLALVKTGPVRVIVRGQGSVVAINQIVAYRSSAARVMKVQIPIAPSSIRLSTDFTPPNPAVPQVIGTFYNAAAPGGVTVDGTPDTSPDPNGQPYSPWWELSTATGTLVTVSDITPVLGTQGQAANYYRDDATLDPKDTGDRRHYGDSGILVTNPRQTFTFTFNMYFPAGQQPNVGQTYNDYFFNPLVATPAWTFQQRVYLPIVMR